MQLSLHCLGCLSFVLQKIGFVKIPKFVISSFRHIFSIDMPTTLFSNAKNWEKKLLFWHIEEFVIFFKGEILILAAWILVKKFVFGKFVKTCRGLDNSPLFHQARPEDYAPDLLRYRDPISFHKFWNTDPMKIYDKWFRQADQKLKAFKEDLNNSHDELWSFLFLFFWLLRNQYTK